MDLAKGYALFQFIHFASPVFGKRWRSGRLHRVPDLYIYNSTALLVKIGFILFIDYSTIYKNKPL